MWERQNLMNAYYMQENQKLLIQFRGFFFFKWYMVIRN